MNIVSLEAENIKALKAVSIKPDGSMVEITGKNGQGKSSILDAIWWALAGASHIQSAPIRNGETKARIKLDLGELLIERRFTEKGTSLTVENADGAQYKSPQGMLNDLLGALTFDPLSFVSKPAKDQFEMLRETLGLDFSEIDERLEAAFSERTDVNRDVKSERSRADGIVLSDEVPSKRIDTNELAERLGKAANHNSDVQARVERRRAAKTKIDDNLSRAVELRKQADDLAQEAEALKAKLAGADELPELIDIDVLQEQLRTANDRNELWEEAKRKSDHAKRADDLQAKSDYLTEEIEKLRADKAKLIAGADMPVEGLGFGDGVVTLDGVPFEQSSTAQQIRASVALAMAGNPSLKVIRIKEGSFLDEDNLALIAQMADERGYQVWVERVDSSAKVGIVISDGEVVAVNKRVA